MSVVDVVSDRRRMSQKERVLYTLQRAGLEGVNDHHFYETRIPNARNRVGELLDEGYHIASFADPRDGTSYAKYVLIHGPERLCPKCPPRTRIAKDRKSAPPVQMSLMT